MPKLPIITGEECVQALERVGYRVVRQRGSHVRLHAADRSPVTVPLHKALDRGTLRAIIRTAEISTRQFNELLK